MSERPIRCDYCRTAGKPVNGSECNFLQAIEAFERLRYDGLSARLSREQLHQRLAQQSSHLEAETQKAKTFGCERIRQAEQ